MRIALVSDIHGNSVALAAVIADVAVAAPDRVVCLGDVALDGPDPRGVIARLRDLRWTYVLGNTDAWLVQPKPGSGADEGPESLAIERWATTQLDASDRAFLAAFAPTVAIDLGEHRTMLCYHGAPTAITRRLLPTTPTPELDGAFADTTAILYAGGHTHEAMVRRYRAGFVINPGSVGMPIQIGPNDWVRHPAWAEYGLVEVDGNAVRIELRRIPIDLAALAALARASGMPHAEWWIAGWG